MQSAKSILGVLALMLCLHPLDTGRVAADSEGAARYREPCRVASMSHEARGTSAPKVRTSGVARTPSSRSSTPPRQIHTCCRCCRSLLFLLDKIVQAAIARVGRAERAGA